MLLPVIMAGGSGSRLWPLSRSSYPKQFLALTSELTMLQETLMRLVDVPHQPPLVICNEQHRFIIAEQLRQKALTHGGIILEPAGRNTAPAIALAALHAILNGEDPILLVLAADHLIKDIEAFSRAVKQAQILANSNKLVTFGIIPVRPEIGYGYIQRGEAINEYAFQVATFVEKPDLATAENYLSSGGYYWNSGMFMFKASRYLEELALHRPDILFACESAMVDEHRDYDFIRLNEAAFQSCPEDSIDYAVMEKTDDAVVIPLDTPWSDIGSWAALWEVSHKDSRGNAIRGDVLVENTNNSYIYSQDKLVATVGVTDLVIVETNDAILIANKNSVQGVKDIVAQLKETNRSEYLQHREVFQPWGSCEAIATDVRYDVKHIIIHPQKCTETQTNYHRAEYWIVVRGNAKVTIGTDMIFITATESVYIPINITHSIENIGHSTLELIEVSTESCLNRADVIRQE